MQQLTDRVGDLPDHPAPAGEASCHPGASTLLLGVTGLHLATGERILQLVPVHPRTDASKRSSRQRTQRRARRARDQRSETSSRCRTAQHTSPERGCIGHGLVPGILLLLRRLLERRRLPGEPGITRVACRTGFPRIRGRLPTSLINRHPPGLLGGRHHHRPHHVVREVLAVGVVEVLHLLPTGEHVSELDVLLRVVPERDAVLLLPEPVQCVAALGDRLLIPREERRQEAVVPAVLRALHVLAGGELRQVLRGVPLAERLRCTLLRCI